MRTNIYSQELILDDEIKVVEGIEKISNTGKCYSAVRMYFHSTPMLHDDITDDDRSAITFWLPADMRKRQILANLFKEMASTVIAARIER